MNKFCLTEHPLTDEIEVLVLLPSYIAQAQKISSRPMIMYNHAVKVQQFDHFIMQRALKLFGKEKDRKGYSIAFRDHRESSLARLEAFKAKQKGEDGDTLGASLYKVLFKENVCCIKDGIYIDMLHSFDDPTVSNIALHDYGLLNLFGKEKNEKLTTQTSYSKHGTNFITKAKKEIPNKDVQEQNKDSLLDILSQ
jgi:hypothetical protein